MSNNEDSSIYVVRKLALWFYDLPAGYNFTKKDAVSATGLRKGIIGKNLLTLLENGLIERNMDELKRRQIYTKK
jgi:DNA-binding MarR family transcriptional regulator